MSTDERKVKVCPEKQAKVDEWTDRLAKVDAAVFYHLDDYGMNLRPGVFAQKLQKSLLGNCVSGSEAEYKVLDQQLLALLVASNKRLCERVAKLEALLEKCPAKDKIGLSEGASAVATPPKETKKAETAETESDDKEKSGSRRRLARKTA
nr:hypothetical protein [Sicyoidochytrium minutum DNA virus]